MADTTLEHGAQGHDPHVAHHFETFEQQFDSGKLGMWLFLGTEILLFGGLFCAYAVYRANHPEIFIYAHQFLDKVLGGVNTLILIASSLTMAWAVRCAQLGKQKALQVLLALTILGGFGFMGIKYVEYKHKWEHGLLWGKNYKPQHEPEVGPPPGHAGAHVASEAEKAAAAAPAPAPVAPPSPAPAPAAPSVPQAAVPPTRVPAEPSLVKPAARGPDGTVREARDPHAPRHEDVPRNVQTFFGIYFVMTGLHGIHVLAGMVAIGILLMKARRGVYGPSYFTPVDLVGLYWHVVDLIWIFLFPLLYLIH